MRKLSENDLCKIEFRLGVVYAEIKEAAADGDLELVHELEHFFDGMCEMLKVFGYEAAYSNYAGGRVIAFPIGDTMEHTVETRKYWGDPGA